MGIYNMTVALYTFLFSYSIQMTSLTIILYFKIGRMYVIARLRKGLYLTVAKDSEHPKRNIGSCVEMKICIVFQPGGSDSEESACSVGNLGLIPGLGRSPGEGNNYPLQYSDLGEDDIERSLSENHTEMGSQVLQKVRHN